MEQTRVESLLNEMIEKGKNEYYLNESGNIELYVNISLKNYTKVLENSNNKEEFLINLENAMYEEYLDDFNEKKEEFVSHLIWSYQLDDNEGDELFDLISTKVDYVFNSNYFSSENMEVQIYLKSPKINYYEDEFPELCKYTADEYGETGSLNLNKIIDVEDIKNDENIEISKLKEFDSLQFLLNSQGHNLADLYKINNKNEFINSLKEELYAYKNNLAGLVCFPAKVDLNTYLDLHFEEVENIKIPKECMCGINDGMGGSGSGLGIKLEKDIVLSKENFLMFSEYNSRMYSIEDIHGLYLKVIDIKVNVDEKPLEYREPNMELLIEAILENNQRLEKKIEIENSNENEMLI